ncbi:MAG: dihydrofolate reductase family protein [bacterium]
MRKVTLIMNVSIDGYVVAPKDADIDIQTMAEPAELKKWKLDRISRAGTHIMGRVTYEGMKTFWPTSKDPYAAPMNDIPKVVFSKTLKKADWPESTIATGELATEIAALRKLRGGEIIAWGGARFAQALIRADLIDEFALITAPVAYGGGKPLFIELPKALQLKVLGTTNFASGHMLRQYTARSAGRA